MITKNKILVLILILYFGFGLAHKNTYTKTEDSKVKIINDFSDTITCKLDNLYTYYILNPVKELLEPKDYENHVTIHEAGHATYAILNKNIVTKISLSEAFTTSLFNKNDKLNLIRYFLAGKVAEEIIFNQKSCICSSDMENATKLAQEISSENNTSFNEILDENYLKVWDQLSQNLEFLKYLTENLSTKKDLNEKDISDIISDFKKKREHIKS